MTHGPSAASQSMRGHDLRGWLVAILSVVVLSIVLPTATLGWRDSGNFGFTMDRWTGRILTVVPRSPAARAGLRAGEAIVSASLSSVDRIRLIEPPPKATVSFAVRRPGGAVRVGLVAQRAASRYGRLHSWLIVSEILTFAAFVSVGTLLFVLRPGWMTFALYAYCIGTAPLDALVPFYTYLPGWLLVPSFVIARTLLSGFSALPLLPFVLRFPLDSASGWRARALAPAIVVVLIGLAYYGVLAHEIATRFVPNYRLLDDVPALVAYVAALVLLIAGYLAVREGDRQRLTLAVAGMACAFVAIIFDYVPGLPVAVYPVANTLSLVMPLTMLYAVFKHRVFDVRFFVNRAFVFSVSTSVLLVAIISVEWLVTEAIGEQHLALAATALVSVGVGLAFNKVHERAETALDRVLFKRRYHAQEYLARVGRALSEATMASAVSEALVREPCDELRLTSAAVFTYDERENSYVRTCSVGWHDKNVRALDINTALVRTLRAERKTLRTGELRLQAEVPLEPPPVIAVPVLLGRDLLALVLYGAHLNTTDIDPDEARLLEHLAREAAIAYMQVLVREQERDLAQLRAEHPPL